MIQTPKVLVYNVLSRDDLEQWLDKNTIIRLNRLQWIIIAMSSCRWLYCRVLETQGVVILSNLDFAKNDGSCVMWYHDSLDTSINGRECTHLPKSLRVGTRCRAVDRDIWAQLVSMNFSGSTTIAPRTWFIIVFIVFVIELLAQRCCSNATRWLSLGRTPVLAVRERRWLSTFEMEAICRIFYCQSNYLQIWFIAKII